MLQREKTEANTEKRQENTENSANHIWYLAAFSHFANFFSILVKIFSSFACVSKFHHWIKKICSVV